MGVLEVCKKLFGTIKKIVEMFKQVEQKQNGGNNICITGNVTAPISINNITITEIKKQDEIKSFYTPIGNAVSISIRLDENTPPINLWFEMTPSNQDDKKYITVGKYFSSTKDKKTVRFWVGLIADDNQSGLYIWVTKKECPPVDKIREHFEVTNGKWNSPCLEDRQLSRLC
jgi:hypothetical protein